MVPQQLDHQTRSCWQPVKISSTQPQPQCSSVKLPTLPRREGRCADQPASCQTPTMPERPSPFDLLFDLKDGNRLVPKTDTEILALTWNCPVLPPIMPELPDLVGEALDFRGYAAAWAQAWWTSRISWVVAGRGVVGINRAAMIWRRSVVSMSRVEGSVLVRYQGALARRWAVTS
jgi:hypothetical protein